MHKPLITITIAYSTGLLLGHGFLYFPYSIIALLAFGIVATGVLTRTKKLTFQRGLLTVAPAVVGMAAYLYSAAWFPADHYTRAFIPDNKQHEFIGTITSPLDRDAGRTAFILDVNTIDHTPVSGRVRVNVREETTLIGYGDTIHVFGRVLEPRGFYNPGGFDYPAYLAQNGIYHTVSIKSASNLELLRRGGGIVRTVQDWRERIRQSFLASTTGHGSAILQAMVIGEEGGLTDDLRDRFMAAGVTHIISISGSHLGMVAILCFGLLRSLVFLLPERYYHRLTLHVDPRKIAAGLTIPLLVFYTVLAGGQVATIRSLIMIMAGLLALALDRDHALLHTLAIAALLILLPAPQAIFDISFQLSYLSVLVIGYVVITWNDLEVASRGLIRTLRNSILVLVAISLSTSIATGPLVAYYFNQFSFAGILSNLLVVPFAGLVVVPLGLFSGVLSLFFHHLPFAAANQVVADAFVRVVDFFSRLPLAEFHPPAPTIVWLLLAAFFMVSLGVFARARLLAWFKPFKHSLRAPRIAIIGTALSGFLLLFSSAYFVLQNRGPEITFLDVGQGDCTLIRLRSGKTILIDGGGTHDNRFDIGRRVVAPALWNKGIHEIELVILSHPHPDHMNGLRFIMKKFKPAQVWESGRDPGLPGYAEFRQAIAEQHTARKTVSAEDGPVTLGEAELKVLHPSRSFPGQERQAYAAENNRSLVVRIAFDGKTCLFPGDIGAKAERHIVRAAQDLRCDLLKVPHHGSKSSSSETFAAMTRPEAAVIMVGGGNRYRHPSDEVIARYEKSGARTYRTDQDGAVLVQIEDRGVSIGRWRDLILARIDLLDPPRWSVSERRNWQRLLVRMTAKYA